MTFYNPYNNHIRTINKEAVKESIRMNILNHYRTSNRELVYDSGKEYSKYKDGLGTKNYNVNRLTYFKDIPDGIEILIDYVNATVIRSAYISPEIIYESIYRELPELFEE